MHNYNYTLWLNCSLLYWLSSSLYGLFQSILLSLTIIHYTKSIKNKSTFWNGLEIFQCILCLSNNNIECWMNSLLYVIKREVSELLSIIYNLSRNALSIYIFCSSEIIHMKQRRQVKQFTYQETEWQTKCHCKHSWYKMGPFIAIA